MHQQLLQRMRQRIHQRYHQRKHHNEYFSHQKYLEQLNPIGRYNFVSTSSLPSESNTSLSHLDSPPENTMIPHPAVGFSTELKAYHAAIMLCIYLTASVATNPVETYAALAASAPAILKPVRATIRILL